MTTTYSIERLREAMGWVIPEDASPGAGSDAGLNRLLALIKALDIEHAYTANLDRLQPTDLAKPSDEFAQMFIEHVRDVYYATPDTGSWNDIGFEVTD